MKRILVLTIIISLILCGCAGNSTTTEATIPTEKPTTAIEPTIESDIQTVPVEPLAPVEPVYTQQPMVAVSLPLSTEYTTSDDAHVYHYTYQNMYLTLQDQQIADQIIVDYLNRVSANNSVSEELAAQAQEAYTGATDWNPHFFESIYSPMRIDTSILSLFGHNVIFTGGNHPLQECTAANYNMITGDVLTLGSILCDVNSIEPLCDLVIKKLEQQKNTLTLFDDYAQVVQARFAREASYDEDWYFSENGLCFFFAPYEIAPYISGIVTAEIPYSELTNIIDDAFFPPEEDHAEGTIYVTSLDQINIEDFTQLTELSLDESNAFAFIYCDGLVRDVRIDTGIWNDDGSEFISQATVFASATLSPGDGIITQALFEDALSALKITYCSGENNISQYIIKNSEDGSYCFADLEG